MAMTVTHVTKMPHMVLGRTGLESAKQSRPDMPLPPLEHDRAARDLPSKYSVTALGHHNANGADLGDHTRRLLAAQAA